MKANELMVGDWVQDRSGAKMKIMNIEYHCTRVLLDGEELILACFEQANLMPIPLTSEILEKNGFVENRGVTSWKFETDREDLIDIYGVNDYHLSINIKDTHGSGKGYRWMLNNLTIFHVHQLQHALRLCKIKKEIEL